MTFLDTSAIYALADRRDLFHAEAVKIRKILQRRGEGFLTHSYVVSESAALVHHRLGLEAAKVFLRSAKTYTIEWIGPDLHEEGRLLLEQLGRRNLELVDCLSFVVMRKRSVAEAFTFDDHFKQQGFFNAPGER